jgi:hypothetical protein
MRKYKKIIKNLVIKEDCMIFKKCLIEKVFKLVLVIYQGVILINNLVDI